MKDTDFWGEDRWGHSEWSTWRRHRGRRFRRGALKYVVLKLLSELPRHGYDLIRAFREHGWGAGPGSVYPLLAFLERQGYVTSRQEGERRTYEITDKGRQFLGERAAEVAAFFKEATAEPEEEPADELHDALERLVDAVKSVGATAKTETVARVRDLIDRARKDIYTLLAQE